MSTSASFVCLMTTKILGEETVPVRSDISPALLSPFGRVFLEDSTQITLNEKLADRFRGSGELRNITDGVANPVRQRVRQQKTPSGDQKPGFFQSFIPDCFRCPAPA